MYLSYLLQQEFSLAVNISGARSVRVNGKMPSPLQSAIVTGLVA
jgi:hypothetical protein